MSGRIQRGSIATGCEHGWRMRGKGERLTLVTMVDTQVEEEGNESHEGSEESEKYPLSIVIQERQE